MCIQKPENGNPYLTRIPALCTRITKLVWWFCENPKIISKCKAYYLILNILIVSEAICASVEPII